MMSSYVQKASELGTGRQKLTSSTQNTCEYWVNIGVWAQLLTHDVHSGLLKNGEYSSKFKFYRDKMKIDRWI